MTLIATFSIDGFQVFIGDSVLSRDTISDELLSIPSMHDPNSKIDKDFGLSISGLVQKINIIGKNICICWAGRRKTATSFINYVSENADNIGYSVEKFENILRNYEPNELHDCKFIISFFNGQALLTRTVKSPIFEFDEVRNIQVYGSGSDAFLREIENFSKFTASRNFNPLERTISTALSFSASAFAQQIISGTGIEEGWGGAFEISYLHKGEFKKLGDILYIFASIRQTTEYIDFKILPFFVKSYYDGEYFMNYVVSNLEDPPTERLYAISPMQAKEQPKDIKIPNLEYKWLVIHSSVLLSNSDVKSNISTHYFGKSYRPIIIKAVDNNFQISTEGNFIQKYLVDIFSLKK
ncbi:hypothetical protein [Nitrospirillum sp. BR 11163]|uniref:hypothetical protein n=1 Tax=Nitrospirillum sp. BR 11163 TaxID=3104323 RepID=UPI002AFFA6FF|nr:hypothetical protein [Nitrospirillum sp. BR 11163]MEA1673999.1 hypothetical protein [Nitrospirillum sp. BR 11163]